MNDSSFGKDTGLQKEKSIQLLHTKTYLEFNWKFFHIIV